MFGLTEEEQWESMEERYLLFKRLWSEENVTWSGNIDQLDGVTTQPRPFCRRRFPCGTGAPPAPCRRSWRLVWASRSSPPTRSILRPKYKALIDHYRERLAQHGHDPAKAVVGAGAGSLYLADTTEEAVKRYRPYYDALHSTAAAKHNNSPFSSLEDDLENGPSLEVVRSASSRKFLITSGHTAVRCLVSASMA